MRKIIEENDHYAITVNIAKNRIIIKPIGFWRSVKVVPNYLSLITNTIDTVLRKKFMVIFEASEMMTHPQEVQEHIHAVGIKKILDKSPSAVVVVVPKDGIALMQAQFLNKQTGLPMKAFSSNAEAEAFLDAYAEKHHLI